MSSLEYAPAASSGTQYLIQPTPTVSIRTEFNYANDVIIGYNYIITLNGYATNYKEGIDNEEKINLRTIRKTINSIDIIREIFYQNGNNLTIKNDDGIIVILAKGGLLRSISFDQSSNNWMSYSPYTIELVFNELELMGETFYCASSYIDSNSITSKLVDINKYKIKNFNDSWSFTIDDNNLNYVLKGDNGETFDIDNSSINLQYNLSATGKNYFINNNLSPAWIQAKNFVQSRLYDQVRNISNVLKITTGSGCSPGDSLSDIHGDGPGIIGTVSETYKVFNETINCTASESDGTFAIVYNCILKNNKNSSFSSSDTFHNVTKNISYARDGKKNNFTISIEGTIEGLCDGGLVQSSGNFILQQSGTLLISSDTANKFDNANNLSITILNTKQDDLSDIFKNAMDINLSALGLESGQFTCGAPIIKPSSFNLTKNYMEGTINYNVEYTTDRVCSNDQNTNVISRSTITINNPVKVLAEFPTPKGNYIIQELKTNTAKTISFTAEGRKARLCCSADPEQITQLISSTCTDDIASVFPFINFPDENAMTVTEKNYNYNPIDGSFTINLQYTCVEACDI